MLGSLYYLGNLKLFTVHKRKTIRFKKKEKGKWTFCSTLSRFLRSVWMSVDGIFNKTIKSNNNLLYIIMICSSLFIVYGK